LLSGFRPLQIWGINVYILSMSLKLEAPLAQSGSCCTSRFRHSSCPSELYSAFESFTDLFTKELAMSTFR
jgi:hypothetical protein